MRWRIVFCKWTLFCYITVVVFVVLFEMFLEEEQIRFWCYFFPRLTSLVANLTDIRKVVPGTSC